MTIKIETTEGPMEIDFDKMELYVQRGDLCWPITVIGLCRAEAVNPLSGDRLLIERGDRHYYIRRHTETIGSVEVEE